MNQWWDVTPGTGIMDDEEPAAPEVDVLYAAAEAVRRVAERMESREDPNRRAIVESYATLVVLAALVILFVALVGLLLALLLLSRTHS